MSNPIVTKLKELDEEKIKVLTTGVRVIIPGISQFMLQEMAMSADTVKPPRFVDPETGREVENTNDPDYIEAVNTSNMKKGLRLLDAMLVGVILVDGLPDNDDWVDELRFQEKLGTINLSNLDFNRKIEKEYAYKKYIAFLDKADTDLLQVRARKVEEAAEKTDAIFPVDEARTAVDGSAPEEGSQGEAARDNV